MRGDILRLTLADTNRNELLVPVERVVAVIGGRTGSSVFIDGLPGHNQREVVQSPMEILDLMCAGAQPAE